ncbi:(2Fe-2S)-binding protein [Hyphomicrobium sp. xq]|uniref:Bacterioferritin-associated ferredoxin n=1 Tax=Hyphomicrobium album TaxID=2665159 RepID=A0A6I3KK93_9HYPH|nr:(2Fe-2S)-binding protein [Hyphomicrobium album]
MIICSCNALSDSQVRAVANRNNGLRVTQVHFSLDCRPRCGRCFSTIEAILESKADAAAACRLPILNSADVARRPAP